MLLPFLLAVSTMATIQPEADVIQLALSRHFELSRHDASTQVLVGNETKPYVDVKPSDPHLLENDEAREALAADFVRRNEQPIAIHASLPDQAIYVDLSSYQNGEHVDWPVVHSAWPKATAVVSTSRVAFTPDGTMALVLVEEHRQDGYLGHSFFLRRDASGQMTFAHIVRIPRPVEVMQREKNRARGE